MNAIGKGLASLIPKRNREDAEEIIEQIESMEEESSAESRSEESQAEQVEVRDDSSEEAAEPADLEESEQETKVVSVVEDFDEFDEMEDEPRPIKPNVSPLPLDSDPESEVEAEPPATTPSSAKTTPLFAPTTPLPAEVVAAATAKMKDAGEKKEKAEPKVEVAPKVAKKASKPVQKEKKKEKAVLPKPQKETAEINSTEDKVTRTKPEMSDLDRVLGETVEYVPLGDIDVNPLQPRRNFDDAELEELVQSLGQHGMLQPLVVMKKADGPGYQLLAGERRMRAAKKLGWREVPCVVRSNVQGDRHRLELALTENVQRQNLNPIEEALGYKRLNEEYGMSHEEIGQRVGRSRVGITNILRVLQLPAEIQRGLINGKITIGHARAILMIPDQEKQIRFYQHVLDEGLTVRKTENRARNIQRAMNLNDPLRNKSRGRHELALKYDGQLQEKFGYNARVKFNQQKNRFEVTFIAYNEPEANELCGRLMGLVSLPENVDGDVLED